MIYNSLILSGAGIVALLLGILLVLLIWNKPIIVIYIQIIYCCIMRFLVNQLGLPDVLKYFSDFLTVILLIQIILHFNNTKTLNIRKPIIAIILFIAVSIFSTVYNNSSFIFFVWGARSYYRFFIFFIACTVFLKIENIDKIIKILLFFLPLNGMLAAYQYAIMGLRDDYVGGFFGIEKGCNAEMNLYLTAVILAVTVFYVIGKMNIIKVALNIGMAAFIAAISELKTIYILIPVIVLAVFFLAYSNKRAVNMILISSILVAVGLFGFLLLYPDWAKDFEDLSLMWAHTVDDGYAGELSVGRFTAGPFLLQNILIENSEKLLGVGFGNASSFLTFVSDSYERYDILKYHYFSYSLLLFEIGIIGLIAYCLFFITVIFESLRVKRKIKTSYNYYCIISLLFAILVFQFIVYDQAMYMDCAFIGFFILSFPFIIEKDVYEKYLSLPEYISDEAVA